LFIVIEVISNRKYCSPRKQIVGGGAMIQGILIGLGAGLALYSVVSWVAGHLICGKSSNHIEADGKESTQIVVSPRADLGSKAEKPAPVSKEKPSVDQGLESAVAPGAPAPELPNRSVEQPADEAQTDKQWFLVRSNKGYLRVAFLRAKTPKAVAGPFATKGAALQAKGLYVAKDHSVTDSARQ
jgi:hypothetical protein